MTNKWPCKFDRKTLAVFYFKILFNASFVMASNFEIEEHIYQR